MRKIIWVKFAWSEYYRGGPVGGNFRWLNEGKGEGHEAYNFMPGPNGEYFCYVPPHGPSSASPSHDDPYGWTVICLAKFPRQTGVHVVGWLEDATLEGNFVPRPEYATSGGFRLDSEGEKFSYSIKSTKAYFVPPEFRTNPFSHNSIKQSKYSYLSGPGVQVSEGKKQIIKIIDDEINRLSDIAVFQPSPITAQDDAEDRVNPFSSFGSPEHRKKVELAAEVVVKNFLENKRYEVINRSMERGIGFDLHAKSLIGKEDLLVEVKGTSGSERRFYLTASEIEASSSDNWRLAIVTNALSNPEVKFLTGKQVEDGYSLRPLAWVAREVVSK